MVGKQDGEMKEKEKRIEDLEQLLEQCNEALLKKKDMQREMEEHFAVKLEEFGRVVSFKDKEIRELKVNLAENEEEMKYLVQEIEKQRKQAKENIEKLNMLFK